MSEVKKNMKQSSKIALCCTLVAAIIITGYVNFKANNKAEESAAAVAEGEMTEEVYAEKTAQVFFAQYRTEREQTRNQEIEYLDSIINSGEVEETVVTEAANQKLAITKAMETELLLEGLLQTSGYDEAVVTYSEGLVNVVVAKEALSEEEALQILEIVKNETGENPQNIKIIPQG